MDDLVIHTEPESRTPTMVLGLTGWMDGGKVSTATIGLLRDRLSANLCAEITPDDFYVYNFPVSALPITVFLEAGRAVVAPINPMEIAALFRPHTEIEDGEIRQVRLPRNQFWYAPSAGLLLFSGEEPHIRWGSFAGAIFELARRTGVERMIFTGSVASPVPHTRQPRVRASVTNPARRAQLQALGVEFTTYRGPASLITMMAHRAPTMGIEFLSLVVEVPHYPFLDMPTYPRSILRVASVLVELLGLPLDLDELRAADDAVQSKLNAAMAENREFRELVAKLEEAYDLEHSEADEALLRQLIDSIDLEDEGE